MRFGCTITSVRATRSQAAGLGLSLAVAAVTLLPYLLAQRMVGSGEVFSGFLINPLDGFSYLAKMRQGADGSWLFHLPYAADPGNGAFVYVYLLFLGHLARAIGAPLITVYHGARLVAAAAMFVAAFAFFGRVSPEGRIRWSAFLLVLFGAGLGWALLPLGILSAELWMPEVTPFLSAYANAHFPLAAAALLGGVLAIIGPKSGEPRLLFQVPLAIGCGTLLAILQPFAVIGQAIILAVWFTWETLRERRSGALLELWRRHRARLLPYLAWVGAAVPWLAYDYWLARTQPVIAAWAAQNQTPSPPPWEFAAGYGVVLLLALVGLLPAWREVTSTGRLLLVWVVVNAVLLYAPVGLQRRMALGLFFPLAALAGRGLEEIAAHRVRFKPALAFALILAVPSNLVVMGAGLTAVRSGDPSLVMPASEVRAYGWVAGNLPGGALVLAAPVTGNRLPAYADVRVLYGHPFETPDAEAQRALVESLFTTDGPPDEGLARLSSLNVDYVYYGVEEQRLGSPPWLSRLTMVHAENGIRIYQVPRP